MALTRGDIAVTAQNLILAELEKLANDSKGLRAALYADHGGYGIVDFQLLQQRIRDGRALLAWMWGQSA